MPFKRVPQKFTASIKEVVIGTGDKTVTLGGEKVLPLYSFDEPIANPPKIGVEVSDQGPNRDIPGIAEFYKGVDRIPDVAKRACEMPGADFVVLSLDEADPNGTDKSIEECVDLCKAVAETVTLPLVIQGSRNVEKDSKLFPKIAEALQGKNVLLLSAKEENHKAIAVAAVQAYGQKIGAESAVDINLAKQLNVVISQLGVDLGSVTMNVGSAAAGYGYEYIASTLDRIKAAALAQNDVKLQIPIITPVSEQTWSVGESQKTESEAPVGWGPQEERGIDMEVVTAAASIATGSNAVILRHPVSVATISKLVASIV
ncbi:MAG: acetyl-CoA decarbonylase/synthase complex subunit delta [Spirochaetaceae bacterium]|jgi:acetyl-CoA decarbonylase/synthase complex subunit delta|nr:acetyl-CoA decarbonylase/synthase complex subunit delta [Spirochaetaceae bacterium]